LPINNLDKLQKWFILKHLILSKSECNKTNLCASILLVSSISLLNKRQINFINQEHHPLIFVFLTYALINLALSEITVQLFSLTNIGYVRQIDIKLTKIASKRIINILQQQVQTPFSDACNNLTRFFVN